MAAVITHVIQTVNENNCFDKCLNAMIGNYLIFLELFLCEMGELFIFV
jgi:hypothetical protein